MEIFYKGWDILHVHIYAFFSLLVEGKMPAGIMSDFSSEGGQSKLGSFHEKLFIFVKPSEIYTRLKFSA